jgi:DNA-3-methyladenine glycosylase II
MSAAMNSPLAPSTGSANCATAAYAALAERDTVLAGLIDTFGTPDPTDWAGSDEAGSDPLAGLLLHIIGQQISIPAALTIFGRLQAAAGPEPLRSQAVARLRLDELTVLGLSGAKARALHELADAVDSGSFDLEGLRDLDDEAAEKALVARRGIGPWTAQMFLMHQLHRPDILPVGDIGLREAIRRAWALPVRPSEAQVLQLAEPWRPYRSYATALLWRSTKAAPGGHDGR